MTERAYGSACRSEACIILFIASAGIEAGLAFPVHPYMLRLRIVLLGSAATGTAGTILTPCCLLWNLYHTSTAKSFQEEIEYHTISRF